MLQIIIPICNCKFEIENCTFSVNTDRHIRFGARTYDYALNDKLYSIPPPRTSMYLSLL